MKYTTPLLLLAFSTVATTHAEELKDPRTRDIDISHTRIEVAIERGQAGFYSYVYSLTAPLENKGTVTSLDIDIHCDAAPDSYVFPEPPTSLRWSYGASGIHAPVQIYPSPTGSAYMSIGNDNRVHFATFSEPGESHTGFRILSPHPPVDRSYQLRVHWTTGDYDYSNLTDEEWDQLSTRDEFWVTGMTKGPGCSALPEPPALFPGTGNHPDEHLLQYAAPLQSAFHTDADSVTFDIHYADDMIAESFKVEPAWARRFFNPLAGSNQVVELKLHPGMNQFRFLAERVLQENETASKFKPIDGDLFMIRRSSPGNGQHGGKGPKNKKKEMQR